MGSADAAADVAAAPVGAAEKGMVVKPTTERAALPVAALAAPPDEPAFPVGAEALWRIDEAWSLEMVVVETLAESVWVAVATPMRAS